MGVLMLVTLSHHEAFSQLTQPTFYFVLESGSQLWIEGKSTIGGYECVTNHVYGFSELWSPSSPRGDSAGTRSQTAVVSIIVRNLNCGNRAMNRDMYEAMKADKYDEIRFELIDGEAVTEPDSAHGWTQVKVIGTLSIAGVTDTITMVVNIQLLPYGFIRIVGCQELSMHDYEITPPSAFWGLIKADDRLVVRFDLVVIRDEREVVDRN